MKGGHTNMISMPSSVEESDEASNESFSRLCQSFNETSDCHDLQESSESSSLEYSRNVGISKGERAIVNSTRLPGSHEKLHIDLDISPIKLAGHHSADFAMDRNNNLTDGVDDNVFRMNSSDDDGDDGSICIRLPLDSNKKVEEDACAEVGSSAPDCSRDDADDKPRRRRPTRSAIKLRRLPPTQKTPQQAKKAVCAPPAKKRLMSEQCLTTSSPIFSSSTRKTLAPQFEADSSSIISLSTIAFEEDENNWNDHRTFNTVNSQEIAPASMSDLTVQDTQVEFHFPAVPDEWTILPATKENKKMIQNSKLPLVRAVQMDPIDKLEVVLTQNWNLF